MFARLRRRPSYANVTSTLALFVALGGSSYAALRVGSREIRDNSMRGSDVRNRSLTRQDLARNMLDGSVVRESGLARVPRAARADVADPAGRTGPHRTSSSSARRIRSRSPTCAWSVNRVRPLPRGRR